MTPKSLTGTPWKQWAEQGTDSKWPDDGGYGKGVVSPGAVACWDCGEVTWGNGLPDFVCSTCKSRGGLALK